MQAHIRIATPEDLDGIFHVRAAARETLLSLKALEEMGISRDMISDMLETPCGWVAEVDGQIVGFTLADIEEGGVFAAYVLPEHEGKGYSRALLAEAEKTLFTKHQIIWLETSRNSRAASFYSAGGWIEVEDLGQGDARYEKRLIA